MARAYSDDLRSKLLEAHASGKGTLRELAERFGVSVGWAWKVSAAQRQTGSTARTPQRRAQSRVPVDQVRRLVEAQPDMVLRELVVAMAEAGHRVSPSHLWRVLRGMGLRLKKSRSTPPSATQKPTGSGEEFVETVRQIAPEDLIYLDESGVSTQMTRLYARASGGQRVHDAVPGGHWKMLTILGAMDHTGLVAAMTVEAATDREVFLAYLNQVLCPKLRPGHVVVMDNLSAHKVDGVRERIEACGARVLYLPPYSPDLNPIEKAWSKLKTGLRAAGARTAETLHHAIAQLLPSITAQNATAWMRLPLNALHL